MYDLEWKPAAVADLLAIVDYIPDDNPDAAQALKEELETRVSRLRDDPRLYRPGRARSTRDGRAIELHRRLRGRRDRGDGSSRAVCGTTVTPATKRLSPLAGSAGLAPCHTRALIPALVPALTRLALGHVPCHRWR